MAKLFNQTSGTKSLRPRARILRTLGDELISSETVAVIELVKNAYDADATRVLVRFREPLDVGKGSIEVIDNGHGMSLDTIQSAWMEPATLYKKRQPRTTQLRRRVLGEKGIGRFAASRLADRLEVVTRPVGLTREIRVLFDWKQFDDEHKYLDEVDALWEESDLLEIRPGGTTQALWHQGEQIDPNDLAHGTILRMEELRTSWGRNEIQGLRTALSRLVSPFFGQDQANQKDEFHLRLEFPAPFDDLSGVVEPPEALKSPHYTVAGHVDQTGGYNLNVQLRGCEGHDLITGKFLFQDGHKPQCGPFHIELRVWDRDSASIGELAETFSSTIADVRSDLDHAAGINIYRDGFRVLPYGEPLNDWLRLDLRRVQNPTLRVSNNQVVGYVLISADDNPGLRDQSNREGLIEGPALDDLRELVKMVLSLLESRRYAVRHSPRASDQPGIHPSVHSTGLFADFNLIEVRDLISQRHPGDTELLSAVGEKARDLERRVVEVQEVLARYRRLASLGLLTDTVLHDGRAPLTKIQNESQLGLRDIARSGAAADRLVQRMGDRFRTIETQAGVMATVFRKIEPFGGRRRGRPTEVRLEQVIADAFSVLDTEIEELGVQVNLPETDSRVTVDQAEIQEVIINLVQNSLFWLRQVPNDSRQITVTVRRGDQEEIEILLSDSGPGVEPKFRERVFEPYFSTKPEGVGLGLTIAGEIVSEYYAGSLDLLDGGPLPGATFRITLRRRV